MPKIEAHGVEVSYDRIEHHAKTESGPMMTPAEYRIAHHQALPSDILPHQSSGQRTAQASSWDSYCLPGAMRREPKAEKVQTTGGAGLPLSFWGTVCVVGVVLLAIAVIANAGDLWELGKMLAQP